MPAKGVADAMERAPSWGIEPVPERLRVLGVLDTGLLWGNLGVSLLVLVAGTYLVPALSLPQAFLAIAVGSLVGNAMLGVAGLIGADGRVPAMVLLRAPLGGRGSYLPTALNAAQCVGWAIFELLIIATAAAALSDELFGFRAQWAWTLVFGGAALALALLGPIDVVRKVLRKFAVWAVLASLVYLTWWALDGAGLEALLDRPGEGGSSVLEGVDLVVAITVSWIPLAADYTRFSRSRAAAFWGTGGGYLLASVWLWALGAILFFSRDITDPAALPVAVAAGGLGATLALLAVTVDETDEAFANVYSTAVSVQNLAPRLPQRALLVGVAAAATLGALTIDLLAYETFLILLGSFFVPLFGVLLADWLAAGARYTEGDIFRSAAVRPGMIASWIAGFALYQWLHPVGPSWWVDLVERLDPPDAGLGATLPSFALALVLGGAVAVLGRRRV
ncbi:MAG: putative hydroxymethylpyrimidine transporter CytX [Gaiellaceae bacterium]|jgi:putative hydroxymethylpyrimidine transporter CytX|nr:putative hydroxymethylpyrimidine transporter CytX [Gaiellaceae bacterium]